MTLIKSVSGIRGTIGGVVSDNLTPTDIVKFTSAYAQWLRKTRKSHKLKVVVGRDGRISGQMVKNVVVGTLMGMGVDVVHLGMASTPTTEIAVIEENADGGIIITASHNPKNWNALKLLNSNGEFLTAQEGKTIIELADAEDYTFAQTDDLGLIIEKNYDDVHIKNILNLNLVDVDAIKKANFKVAFDSINSVGGIIVPKLLSALGVAVIIGINTEPNGNFAHIAEPLPENIGDIAALAASQKADVAFVVDPDVDRLVIVCEDGTMFGEEYTLVSIADYVLQNTPGNTVSNMSSSRALRDVTQKYGFTHQASAVGEVHVVAKMRETNAIIGGEGSGGIIYPESHSGRDALVGIALFLTHLAKSNMKCSELRASYPNYYISKNKIELDPNTNVDDILSAIEKEYSNIAEKIYTIDGVKIELKNGWIHLRKSNTEPIIRIFAENKTMDAAKKDAEMIIEKIKQLCNVG